MTRERLHIAETERECAWRRTIRDARLSRFVSRHRASTDLGRPWTPLLYSVAKERSALFKRAWNLRLHPDHKYQIHDAITRGAKTSTWWCKESGDLAVSPAVWIEDERSMRYRASFRVRRHPGTIPGGAVNRLRGAHYLTHAALVGGKGDGCLKNSVKET